VSSLPCGTAAMAFCSRWPKPSNTKCLVVSPQRFRQRASHVLRDLSDGKIANPGELITFLRSHSLPLAIRRLEAMVKLTCQIPWVRGCAIALVSFMEPGFFSLNHGIEQVFIIRYPIFISTSGCSTSRTLTPEGGQRGNTAPVLGET